MNKNAELWVQALRSGRYKQTQGRLRQWRRFPWQRDVFCAMGVLYTLYLRQNGGTWPKIALGRVPDDVLEWAAISRGLEEAVVMYNDQGMSFRDIASVIEAHFARLSARQLADAAQIAQRAIERARATSRRIAEERVLERELRSAPVVSEPPSVTSEALHELVH